MSSSAPSLPREPATAEAPLAAVDRAELAEAARTFATDVLPRLGEPCGWWSPGKSKPWVRDEAAKAIERTGDRAGAVLAHLTGEASFSVAPIRKAIVIDVDLPDHRDKTKEAPWGEKLRAAKTVSLVLDTFGIPHMHVDTRGGVHTWVRLEDDRGKEVFDALKALLRERLKYLGTNGDAFELFPKGSKGIRLPFGITHGVARKTLHEMPVEDVLEWLRSPRRATDDELTLLVKATPQSPKRERRPATRRPVALAQGAERAAHEAIDPPGPIPGWDRWPRCKQMKAVMGLERRGERHWTYLMVAAEAILHAPDLSEEELVAIQVSIQLHGYSTSSKAERESDAWQNAKDVTRRLREGNPVLTGCPRSDGGDSELRATFADYCMDERAAVCPLVHPQPAGLTPYAPVLGSSIWRGAQGGKTDGLGLASRAVFEFAVEQARGRPRIPMELTARYVEARRPYVPANAAGKALKRLSDPELGLLIKIDDGTYMLSEPLSADEVAELEEKLGTAEAHRKAIARHEQHWEGRRRSREDGMRALAFAPGEGTPF